MRPSLQRTSIAVLVTGCLVLLNVLGLRAFKRLDVTRDRMYTLSGATRETLGKLEDPITVSAYFTENLPPPFAQNARYVRDLLEEYRAASHGKLAFELIDPAKQESDADKEKKRDVKRDPFGRAYREQTEMEKELTAAGLEPVRIQTVEEDQQQQKLAYMGIVLKYEDKRESIPVVKATDTLEYELTTLIRKMVRKKAPVVALATPASAPSAAGDAAEPHFTQLRTLFEQLYEVRPLSLDSLTEVPADAEALFVLAPERPVNEAAQKAIDAFVMRGKSVAFFVDLVRPDPRTFAVNPVEHGLGPLLESYGVKIGDGLVADVESAQLTVQEQRGAFRFAVPVRYPFVPIVPQLEGDSPITQGLTKIALPFVAPLTLVARDGVQEMVLAKSSPKSWTEQKPFNTDPRRDWREESPTFAGPYPLLVQLTGKLKSPFGASASGDARVIVAGGSAMAWDEFLNPNLLLNVADFLMLEQGMLAMRTRGLAEAPLKTGLSDGVRNAAKYGNAVGVPLLLALFGLVMWRMREARRSRVTV